MSSTITGRRRAEQVARLTATSTWAWVAKAEGKERTRRATVRRIARLTGTEPIRWEGEISDADWNTVLVAGADALLAQVGADPQHPVAFDLVLAAEEITARAVEADTVLERTAVLTSAPVPGRAVAVAADNPERTPAEQALVEKWSPFSTTRCAAARYVVRCADGTRRYGNGDQADPH
ncbi:hypothetical protein ACIHEI_34025 [Kitasatospora sp. NPDC051984]|uniref:hypothetical protein n=1 Tax=Kitasatospora sp. NPDC051984 TaxID=3364059 RepID=UPI0037C5442B